MPCSKGTVMTPLSLKQITPEHIDALNKGIIEAKNLMETLAIDPKLLLFNTFPDIAFPEFPAKVGITKKMALVGEAIYDQYRMDLFEDLIAHPSDTIRGFAAYVLQCHEATIAEKLELVKPLADDPHFGVREWAWIALRDDVIQNLEETLSLLRLWTIHASERFRRFASEITRPRGVWCAHIKALRLEPWLALNILESLKSDPTRYVQLSVGNWLNDAGKDHPNWVQKLCTEWTEQSPINFTAKICKRGLRNLG